MKTTENLKEEIRIWIGFCLSGLFILGLLYSVYQGLYKIFAGAYHLLDKLIDKI